MMTNSENQTTFEQETLQQITDIELSELTAEQLARDAIARHFPEAVGKLQVKKLWDAGETKFYRVNWLRQRTTGEYYIAASHFLQIIDDQQGVRVSEVTNARHAA